MDDKSPFTARPDKLYELDLFFERNTPIHKILEFYANMQKELMYRLNLDNGFAINLRIRPSKTTIVRGDMESEIEKTVSSQDARTINNNLNLRFPRETYKFEYPVDEALQYVARNYLELLLQGVE